MADGQPKEYGWSMTSTVHSRQSTERCVDRGPWTVDAHACRPLRVMYVIWSLGLGGAEQALIRLAAGLDRRRFESMICCLNDDGTFAEQARAVGVSVLALRKHGPLDVRVVWRLRAVMRQWRPDIVHTYLWGANCWGRLAARWARVPTLIASERNVDSWKRGYHLAIDRALARGTAQLIAVSQAVQTFYEARGVGRGRWITIYNGVDPHAMPARGRRGVYDALGIPPEAPVVGFVGRLVPVKAPLMFVDVIAQALRAVPNLHAVVVGEGRLRGRMEQAVRRRGLAGRVHVVGLCHDVREFLAGMDAMVFCSEREGLSLAMLEAMASGVPVIATAVGGTPELIDSGTHGWLVPAGDVAGLARRLVEVLTDRAEADRLRQAARARVAQTFSLRKMIEAHERLYAGGAQETRSHFKTSLGSGFGAQGSGPSTDSSTRRVLLPRAPSPQLRAPWGVETSSTRTGLGQEAGLRPTPVVHIIDDLGLGGAQRQLVALLKGASRDRYKISVISLSTTKTAYAEAIRAMGIPLWQLPQRGAWDQRCFAELRWLLRQLEPTIVHTWLFTADLYGRLAAWSLQAPVIISAVRSVEPDKPWRYVLADRLLRHATDAFTVNARATGRVLSERERVSAAQIHTIYNGLDVHMFDPSLADGAVRRRVGIADGAPLIGIVGRLVPVKGHELFLRAAAQICRSLPAARFLIVGDGPLREALEGQAVTLGLAPHVRFLTSSSNVAEVFAALDVVVVASRYEGCCNVILEGMAMGKPVVATAVGGNPELVADGLTGRLVPAADAQRLAEAIIELIRDPARARAMGTEGRRRVESAFTLPRMVAETEALYQALITKALEDYGDCERRLQ